VEGRPFATARAAHVERVLDVGSRTLLELADDDGARVTAEIDRAERARLDPRRGVVLYLQPARFRSFDGALA
jgi:hypothetical protein